MKHILILLALVFSMASVNAHTFYAEQDYQTGLAYYDGQGVDQNYKQAFGWYKKAAEQGHAIAQNSLGVMYQLGEGIPQDYTQALAWFEKAIEQGNIKAQHNLGLMYYNGQGVEQNYKQAFGWYKKAAEQGHANAQYNVGLMYYRGLGLGLEQDYDLAYMWFTVAELNGYKLAHVSLETLAKKMSSSLVIKAVDKASICKNSNYQDCNTAYTTPEQDFQAGLEYFLLKNYKQAVYRYKKAARHGHVLAWHKLGLMYYNGQGVDQNYKQAAYWWKRVAEQGHAKAQYYLGNLYRHGEGVDEDYVLAHMWFNIAVANGNDEAKSSRYNIAKRMSHLQIEEAQDKAKKCYGSEYQDQDCN